MESQSCIANIVMPKNLMLMKSQRSPSNARLAGEENMLYATNVEQLFIKLEAANQKYLLETEANAI